jgi:hypothetical protein
VPLFRNVKTLQGAKKVNREKEAVKMYEKKERNKMIAIKVLP